MDNELGKYLPVIGGVMSVIVGLIANRNKRNDAFIQLVEDLRKDYRELREENVELRKTVGDFKQQISDLQDDRVTDRRRIQELQTAHEGDERRMGDMQREIDTLRTQVPSGKSSDAPIGHVKKPSTGQLPPLPSTQIVEPPNTPLTTPPPVHDTQQFNVPPPEQK